MNERTNQFKYSKLICIDLMICLIILPQSTFLPRTWRTDYTFHLARESVGIPQESLKMITGRGTSGPPCGMDGWMDE